VTDPHPDVADPEQPTGPDGSPTAEPSGETDPGSDAGADDRGGSSFWRELPVLVLVALVVAIVIKTFLVQAFYIPSVSMVPTLERGDRVLVCRLCYRFGDIERGDVIVFADPSPDPHADRGVVGGFLHWLGEGIGVARPEDEDFIKRVIGLPGDVVELRDGTLLVNGEAVEEPYLDPDVDTRPYGPVTVPDGMLFVLGDNRLRSGDSRLTPEQGGVGLVPEDRVIGEAFVIVWPPGRWGGL
jgi:signal peptidase I